MVSAVSVRDLPGAFLDLEQQEQARQAALANQTQNQYAQAKIAAGAPEADVAQTRATTDLTQQQIIAARTTNEVNQLALRDQQGMARALSKTWAEGQPQVQQQPVAAGGVPVQPGTAPTQQAAAAPAQPAVAGAPDAPAVPQATAPAPAPSPEVQGEAAAPPPVQVSVQVPAAASAAPKQTTALDILTGQPLINGLPNFNSNAAITRATTLMRENGVRPQAIQAYVDGITTKRVELAEKFQKLENDVQTGKKTAAEAAEKVRDVKNDTAFDIVKQLQTANTPEDKAIAASQAQGIGLDLSKPADQRRLQQMATASDAAKDERESSRKDAELGLKRTEQASSEMKTDGLAPGYVRVRGTYYRLEGDDRVPVTSFEATTGNAGPKPAGAVVLKDLTSTQRIDAGERVQVATGVLDRTARLAELRANLLKKFPYDPTNSKWSSAFSGWVTTNIENDPEAREYTSLTKSLANDLLRLNKGAQTEGDAQRMAAELPNLGMPPAAHDALIQRMTTNATRTKTAFSDIQRGYMVPGNDTPVVTGPTGQPTTAPKPDWMKPVGGAGGNTPSAPSGGTPIIKSQAAYDALPSGAMYVDSSGKHARKK